MTLSYQMMLERYPNLKEEVGGSIVGCEISSLLDGKLARWSTASCALALACWPSVSKQHNNVIHSVNNCTMAHRSLQAALRVPQQV